MMFPPDTHAENPPETWQVVKAAERCWQLQTKDGSVLCSQPRKRDAEMCRQMGFWVDLYEKERRWYAGEQVAGWKPYCESIA